MWPHKYNDVPAWKGFYHETFSVHAEYAAMEDKVVKQFHKNMNLSLENNYQRIIQHRVGDSSGL
jgi:hypothetical protein